MLLYDPYGPARAIPQKTTMRADVCRAGRVDVSRSEKSCPALHLHGSVSKLKGIKEKS